MKKTLCVVASLCLMLFAGLSSAASFVYDSYLDDVWAGAIAKTDTYKCALVSASGVSAASKASHTKFSDVAGEVSGTGYVAGGVGVVPVFTKDTTNHKLVITFPSFTWSGSTITARGAVCYQSSGVASSSRLVFINDFGADVSSSSGTFTVNSSTLSFSAP